MILQNNFYQKKTEILSIKIAFVLLTELLNILLLSILSFLRNNKEYNENGCHVLW